MTFLSAKFAGVGLSCLRYLLSLVMTQSISFSSDQCSVLAAVLFFSQANFHRSSSKTLLFLRSLFCGANFLYSLNLPILTDS